MRVAIVGYNCVYTDVPASYHATAITRGIYGDSRHHLMEARASPGSKFNRLSLPPFPSGSSPSSRVSLSSLPPVFRTVVSPTLRPRPSPSISVALLARTLAPEPSSRFPDLPVCSCFRRFALGNTRLSVRPFHAFLPLPVIPTKRALRFALFPHSRPRKFCPCTKLVRVAVPLPLFKLYCSFSLPLSLYNVSDFLPVCLSACYFPYISPLELTFSPFCYLCTFRRFIALFSLLRWKFLSLFLPRCSYIVDFRS